MGTHPVFGELSGEAANLGWKSWDPAAFVDECERERGTGGEREAQMAEWQALFG